MVYLTPDRALDVVPRLDGWVMEIGFGNGLFLRWLSRQNPLVLGVDIANLAFEKAASRLSGTNAVVVKSDAAFFLRYLVAPASLKEVYILFPDPWPKNKKRRLIQPDFARLLSSRLVEGGSCYVATDHEEYAQQIVEVLGALMEMENWELPVATKYMKKWESLGRTYRGFRFVNVDPVKMEFKPALRSVFVEHRMGSEVGRVVRRGRSILKVDALFCRREDRLYKLIYSEGSFSSRYFFLQRKDCICSVSTWGEVYPPDIGELIRLL